MISIAKEVYIINPVPEVEHGDISVYFDKHTKEDFEKLIKEQTSINSSNITYDEYSIKKSSIDD